MNAKELRRLAPEELMDELARTVMMARSAIMEVRSRGVLPELSGNPVRLSPLIAIGDFEIWPRDDKPHGERCHGCGCGGGVSMMVVRGPMAFEEGSPERHFCSMGCFWHWMDLEHVSREVGEPIEGELKWTDKTSPN